MSIEIAKKCVKYFVERSNLKKSIFIGFYGGEPLLRMSFIKEIIEYTRREFYNEKIRFNITTNGTLLTKKTIEYIVLNNILTQISLDGPKSEHDKSRRFISGSGSSDTIYNNLIIFKNAFPDYYRDHVIINSVIAPWYSPRKIYDFFSKNELFNESMILISSMSETGIKDKSLINNNKYSSRYAKDIIYMKKKYIQKIRNEEMNEKDLLWSIFGTNMIKLLNRKYYKELRDKDIIRGMCIPGVSKLFVDADGCFHTCERVVNTLPIGDYINGINPNRSYNILLSHARLMNELGCNKCWAQHFCNFCQQKYGLDYKEYLNELREDCQKTLEIIEKDMKLFCSFLEENPKAFKFVTQIQDDN